MYQCIIFKVVQDAGIEQIQIWFFFYYFIFNGDFLVNLFWHFWKAAKMVRDERVN